MVPIGPVEGGKGHSIGGGDAYGGGSANGHILDRFGDLVVSCVGDPLRLSRKNALVKEVEAVLVEFDTPQGVGHGVGLPFWAREGMGLVEWELI